VNDLKIFENPEFGRVRTLIMEGELYFVGKDVAVILGYKNPQEAIRDHVDDDDKGVSEILTPGGKQLMPIIKESGLYSLIMSSKLPNAKRFKRWVTSEVLPSIRKTGQYTAVRQTPKPFVSMAAVLTDVGESATLLESIFAVKHGMALAKALDVAEQTYEMNLEPVKTLLPPAEHETGFLNATEIGKRLGISSVKANKLLAEKGLQHKIGKSWRLKDEGREYGEEVPYVKGGHSGYQIRWNESVLKAVGGTA